MTVDRAPSWTVHVEFVDGTLEDVVGDPTVVGDVLVVRVASDDDRGQTEFEAQYPLRHVRVWWCDYTGGDVARVNARGSRTRLRPSTPVDAPEWCARCQAYHPAPVDSSGATP